MIKTLINHLNLHPRKDDGPKPTDQTKIITNVAYDNKSDSYTVEVLDPANPEFRVLILGLTEEDLRKAKDA